MYNAYFDNKNKFFEKIIKQYVNVKNTNVINIELFKKFIPQLSNTFDRLIVFLY